MPSRTTILRLFTIVTPIILTGILASDILVETGIDIIVTLESYKIFLSALIGAIVTLFSIFFAITIVQVEHTSSRYSPRLLGHLKKDPLIRVIIIYFVVAFLSMVGSMVFVDHFKTVSFIVSMVVACMALICYSYLYIADFLNPEALIDGIRDSLLDDFNKLSQDKKNKKLVTKANDELFQLRQILFRVMKDDIHLSMMVIDCFTSVALKIHENYEYGVKMILAQLKSIGKRLVDDDLYELRNRLLRGTGDIGTRTSKKIKQIKIIDVPELLLELASYAKDKNRINSDDLETIQTYLSIIADQFSSDIRKALKESTPNIVSIIVIIAGLIKNQLKVQERKTLLAKFDKMFAKLIFSGEPPDKSLLERVFEESSKSYPNHHYEINDIKETRRELIMKSS